MSELAERWRTLKKEYESVGDGGSVTHIARELIVTFSTDAPAIIAAIEEREKLREALRHIQLEFDGFAIASHHDGFMGNSRWALECSKDIAAALQPTPEEPK